MSEFVPVPDGTKVMYHGSITEMHGEMTVVGNHTEIVPTYGEYDPNRYFLAYGPKMNDYLRNVRPESFTVIQPSIDNVVEAEIVE